MDGRKTEFTLFKNCVAPRCSYALLRLTWFASPDKTKLAAEAASPQNSNLLLIRIVPLMQRRTIIISGLISRLAFVGRLILSGAP